MSLKTCRNRGEKLSHTPPDKETLNRTGGIHALYPRSHPQGEGGGGWRLHRQPVHHSAAVPALQQAGDTQRSVPLSGMKLPMLYYYIHTYPHTRTHTMPSVVVDGVEWREVPSVRMVATVGHSVTCLLKIYKHSKGVHLSYCVLCRK